MSANAKWCVKDGPELLGFYDAEALKSLVPASLIDRMYELQPGESYRFDGRVVTRTHRVRVEVVYEIDAVNPNEPAICVDAMLDNGEPQDSINATHEECEDYGPMHVASAVVMGRPASKDEVTTTTLCEAVRSFLEYPARAHECPGFACSTCAPVGELERALERADATKSAHAPTESMGPQERREAWKAALAHEIDALSDEMVEALVGYECNPEVSMRRPGASANVGVMLFNIDAVRKDATRRLEREYGTRLKLSYRGR